MKTTLPAVLFVCALIGLTGLTTAHAAAVNESKEPEIFDVVCVSFDRVVLSKDSVEILKEQPDPRFIALRGTLDNRKILTQGTCTFIQRLAKDRPPLVDNSTSFPEDGNPRYAIGY